MTLPDIETLKGEARALRAAATEAMTHSQALEEVARRHGWRDWNTAAAAARSPARKGHNRPLYIGQQVMGSYLGQDFTGEILGLESLSAGRMRVTLHFDEPVDVVEFDSFSNFRQRVSAVLTEDWISEGRTSNGKPHLVLEG